MALCAEVGDVVVFPAVDVFGRSDVDGVSGGEDVCSRCHGVVLIQEETY